MLDFTRTLFSIIPIAEVRFDTVIRSGGFLPSFRGATLRGALGYHLRNTVCNSFKRKCSECFLRQQCAYSLFFEGTANADRSIMKLYPNVPQPFTFVLNEKEPTELQSGDRLSFGMKLFGNANELFPYVVYAISESGKQGIGTNRVRFEINTIQQNNTSLFENGSDTIHKPKPQLIDIPDEKETRDLTLRLLTPLRIRINGKTAKTLSLAEIVTAGLRRISILNVFYGNGENITADIVHQLIAISEKIETAEDNLRPYGFNRYSGRQERNVLLDGVTGSMVFRNVPPELINILRYCETVSLGKSTSFGFGRIQII